MIRTTTRVLGAVLIAFLGLSTVHVSAADKILPVASFGDTLDSIALNTVMVENEDGDMVRLFSDADIEGLDGAQDCSVAHHDFTATADPKTAGPDDLQEEDASNDFNGVICSVAVLEPGRFSQSLFLPTS